MGRFAAERRRPGLDVARTVAVLRFAAAAARNRQQLADGGHVHVGGGRPVERLRHAGRHAGQGCQAAREGESLSASLCAHRTGACGTDRFRFVTENTVWKNHKADQMNNKINNL